MSNRRFENLLNAATFGIVVLVAGAFYLAVLALMTALVGAAYFLAAALLVRGKAVEVLVIAGFLSLLVFRGIFRRSAYTPFGIQARRAAYPRLFAVLDEVAASVGTRPADAVFLTPGPAIGVFETAGFLGLVGRTHRVLELGVATLHDLTLPELQAVLAHEYAHYSSRETLHRRFVARVRSGLLATLAELRRGRFARLSPLVWALRAYAFVFRYFASTFSRQREYSADLHAAERYGGNVLSSGLVKFAVASTLFEGPVTGGLFRLLLEGRVMRNLYAACRAFSGTMSADDLERIRREVMKVRSGLLDDHPCPARRIARIRGVNRVSRGAEEPARTIFEDPRAVEERLSDLLTGRLLGATGWLDALRGQEEKPADP